MSDTPKTNALLTAILDSDRFLNQANAPEKWVNLCREIEHDCDEARRELAELRGQLSVCEEQSETTVKDFEGIIEAIKRDRDEARKSLDFQTKFNYELNEREKRTHEENRELRSVIEDRERKAELAIAAEEEREHENCKLRAEVERLKADKARLDWLEKAKSAEYMEGTCEWRINGLNGIYEDTLRDAIDAAMKGAE